MKTLNVQEMENVEGGRFWGWVCGPTRDTRLTGGACIRQCTYYIFGSGVWTESRSCSNLPGRYGRS